MKLHSRSIPAGALAYTDLDSVAGMFDKLFEKTIYLPFIPSIANDDTLLRRSLEHIPGVKLEGEKVSVKLNSERFKQAQLELENACNNPTTETLAPYAISSVFMEKLEELLVKNKPTEVYINLIGPFTLSRILLNAIGEEIATDKMFKKLFIQAVCAKALWIINKIKSISNETTPIIVLEEPMLAKLGNIKRNNEEINAEYVTAALAKVIEKIKPTGALIAVQCFEKCDWAVPINAGVDIISFDAYNNPNNLCIIPELLTEYLENGGKICWGIIPTQGESVVKSLTLDYLEKRLKETFELLVTSGVPRKLVYNSALVSNTGDTHRLPIIFAEKVYILLSQLAKKIPIVK